MLTVGAGALQAVSREGAAEYLGREVIMEVSQRRELLTDGLQLAANIFLTSTRLGALLEREILLGVLIQVEGRITVEDRGVPLQL